MKKSLSVRLTQPWPWCKFIQKSASRTQKTALQHSNILINNFRCISGMPEKHTTPSLYCLNCCAVTGEVPLECSSDVTNNNGHLCCASERLFVKGSGKMKFKFSCPGKHTMGLHFSFFMVQQKDIHIQIVTIAQSQPPVSHHQPEVTPQSYHYPWSLECSPPALLLSGRLITPTLQGLPSQAASQSGFLEPHTIPDWDPTANPGPITSSPPTPHHELVELQHYSV